MTSDAKISQQSESDILNSENLRDLRLSDPSIRIRKSDLIAYAPKFIERLYLCDPAPPATYSNPIQLPAFILNITNRTRINACTLTAAFYYLTKLKELHPSCKGSAGSGHRLFLAAIIIAAKYMYDDTFDNTAWATVSSGLFGLEQVNHMEREMLCFLDFQLFIKSEDWYQFSENLIHDMRPPGLIELKAIPLSHPYLTPMPSTEDMYQPAEQFSPIKLNHEFSNGRYGNGSGFTGSWLKP